MNWKRLLNYFLLSIPLAAVYYALLAGFVFIGSDAALRKDNRRRAKYLDSLERKVAVLDGAVRSLQARDGVLYSHIFGHVPAEDLYGQDGGSGIDISTAKAMAANVERCIDSVKSNLAYLGSSADNIPSVIPVERCGVSSVGASMGRKVNPFVKAVLWHNGVDIICPPLSNVTAPAEGVVSAVYTDRSAGLVVELDHQNGYLTRYSHLEDSMVKVKDTLRRGQRFARVGMSGKTIAPHLHYEVLLDGVRVNPVNYFFASLSPSEYSAALHKSENSGQSLD